MTFTPTPRNLHPVSEITLVLQSLEKGDQKAAERLLPLVYDELRKLAASKLSRERAAQTLQPTALVHEAYLRLVGRSVVGQSVNATTDPPTDRPTDLPPAAFDSRGHFGSVWQRLSCLSRQRRCASDFRSISSD